MTDSVLIPERFALLEKAVADACLISVENMRAAGKREECVQARLILWYLANHRWKLSAARLARFYGRAHTTVIHGLARARADAEVLRAAAVVEARHNELFV